MDKFINSEETKNLAIFDELILINSLLNNNQSWLQQVDIIFDYNHLSDNWLSNPVSSIFKA